MTVDVLYVVASTEKAFFHINIIPFHHHNLHPRFSEVPYAKLLENDKQSKYTRKVNGETERGDFKSGDLEWGM